MDLAWLHVGIKQPANEWARDGVGILVELRTPVTAELLIIAAFPVSVKGVAVVVIVTVFGVAVVEVLERSPLLLLVIVVFPVNVGEGTVVEGAVVVEAEVEELRGFEVVGAEVWIMEPYSWLSSVVV